MASLISYSVGPIMGYFIKSTRVYSLCMLRCLIKPLLASLMMGCFMYALRNHFLISIMTSLVVYVTVMYLMKAVDDRDLKVMKAIVFP